MAKVARVYETPQEFAEMIRRRLEGELGIRFQSVDGNPLLLNLMEEGSEDEVLGQISLHNTYQTYMNTGNLNAAIDYLNSIIQMIEETRDRLDEAVSHLDLVNVYPALREKAYVEATVSDTISEEALPGLAIVYLESKNGYSKIMNRTMLQANPRLTEEAVKQIAHDNLRTEGWTEPKLKLPNPLRKTCTVDVYTDNPIPIECQFLNSELIRTHMPNTYLIAFPNRETTLVMRTTEAMNTRKRAIELAKVSRFQDVVKQSYYTMPSPNSMNIYWYHAGKYQLLERI